MNIQFGSAVTASQNNPIQGSEARASVAVPDDADNLSSVSFTPVNEVEQAPKSKQGDVTEGVQERRALDEQRTKANQSERRTQERAQKEQQQQERREQTALEESQVDRAIQARRQEDAAEQRQLEADLQQIQKLAERDRAVRAHEQAHQSVAGEFAGAMSLSTERGPDGKQYAVAGEVLIDTSEVANDPRATQDKAQTIRRAALAPADPSSQDRRVAALANQMAVAARADLEKLSREEVMQDEADKTDRQEQQQAQEASSEERLDATQETQRKEQLSQESANTTAAELQELSEKLTRVQAQLQEISQIDDQVQASENLLDIVT
ncbi:MAG: putative metalloprotease CJM1_0395 family protein [Bermanella sp.]